ncbi:hypothetical protein [Microbacterium sp. K24]|uniref:hypothetical protein n=1 Tax=Microbacterium sp. K24 TaxID=2305446 RepID=UPI00109D21B2|nr:hypothetical protein [Microbacterium sp. K24]
MTYTNAAKEAAALAVAALGNSISLHTADPGITGASEVSGGSPAYARKTTTWAGGAVDGVVSGSPVVFDVPAGEYKWLGQWNGSTFIGGLKLASSTGALPGQQTVTVIPTIPVVDPTP